MKNLNNLMDCILYQIFKTFEYMMKKSETFADIPPKRLYVNKIENKITQDKNNTTKYENGEKVPHLEVTEVVLVHCNIVNN